MFKKLTIAAGSHPYKPKNFGIKISHGGREIAFCPVGYFNLSHPVCDVAVCIAVFCALSFPRPHSHIDRQTTPLLFK